MSQSALQKLVEETTKLEENLVFHSWNSYANEYKGIWLEHPIACYSDISEGFLLDIIHMLEQDTKDQIAGTIFYSLEEDGAIMGYTGKYTTRRITASKKDGEPTYFSWIRAVHQYIMFYFETLLKQEGEDGTKI